MTEERLIGLAISGSYSYYRSVLRGIAEFAHQNTHWNLTFISPQISPASRRSLKQVDAVIAMIHDRNWCQFLLDSGIPVVNISAVLPDLPIRRVNVDGLLLGKIAGEHFLERGFQSFGFVGNDELLFSRERRFSFQNALEDAGFTLSAFTIPQNQRLGPLGLSRAGSKELGNWLNGLRLPVGILTPDDLWGLEFIEFCKQQGLRVPDDVAVLGVDDDDLFCGISSPPLSSIIIPAEAIGFRAAEEAEELINKGQAALLEDVLIPPIGIAVRKSTDIFAVEDQKVVAALEYYRRNSHRPVQVTEIADHIKVSRRWLERHVHNSIGISLGEYIRRSRLERAKQLLVGSSLSIAEVAARSGFTNLRHIESVFRAALSCTPSQFREGRSILR